MWWALLAILAGLALAEPDPFANATTGWLPVSAEGSLFYWLYAPQAAPSDDVVLWLNGGPGTSSVGYGLFHELGPVWMDDASGTMQSNPFAWNRDAHLLFVDQPVGTGYSFCAPMPGCLRRSLNETTADLAAFVAAFYDAHPALRAGRLFLAGESYGGLYVPWLADALLLSPQNVTLGGLLLGSGVTDTPALVQGIPPTALATGLVGPDVAAAMARAADECAARAAAGDWIEALAGFGVVCGEMLAAGGLPNKYNMRLYEPYNFSATEAWLNGAEARARLAPVPAGAAEFRMDAGDVEARLLWQLCQAATPQVERALAAGVPVVAFSGQDDPTVTPIGTDSFVRGLDWAGKDAFAAAPRVPFHAGGQMAGYRRQSSLLTHVVFVSAGHLVPREAGAGALEMLGWVLGS